MMLSTNLGTRDAEVNKKQKQFPSFWHLYSAVKNNIKDQ